MILKKQRTAWDTLPFLDCCKTITPPKKIPQSSVSATGSIPVVDQSKVFIAGYTNETDSVIHTKRPIVIFGDHTREVKFVDFDFAAGADGTKILQPIEQVDPKFFYYALRNINLKSLGYSRHFRELKKKKISFPTLLEQRRIAAKLDALMERVAEAEKMIVESLEYSKQIIDSQTTSLFTQNNKGWNEKSLGSIAAFRNGINFTKTSRGEALKIVGVKDFQNNFWAPLDALATVITEGKLPNEDMIKENDILFVRSNGNIELIGRCLLIAEVKEKITFSGFTIRARLISHSIQSKYLCYFLKSKRVRQTMTRGGAGANIKSLNQSILSNLMIPIPDHTEQTRIIKQLEKLEASAKNLEAAYTQRLKFLRSLRSSILDSAFRGELPT